MRLAWGVARPLNGRNRDAAEAVVGGMGEAESAIRRIHVPLGSRRKAMRVWRSLLDIELPGGTEGKLAAPLEFSPSGNGWEVTVAVADEEAVHSRIEAYRRLGFDVHVLDQESVALWSEALREFPPRHKQEQRVVLHGGENGLTAAVGMGADLKMTAGFRSFDDEDIRRLLRSAGLAPNGPLRWIWGGVGVEKDEDWQRLRTILSVEKDPHERFSDPSAVLARAYAVRALESGPYRCNFRIGRWVHPEAERRRWKRRMASVWMALTAGLLALTGFLYNGWTIQNSERQVRRALRDAATEIGKLLGVSAELVPGYEVQQAASCVKEAEPTYRPFIRATHPSAGLLLSRVLSLALDAGVEIQRLEWTPDTLLIAGAGPDQEKIRAWSEGLEGVEGLSWQRKDITPHGNRWAFEMVAETR